MPVSGSDDHDDQPRLLAASEITSGFDRGRQPRPQNPATNPAENNRRQDDFVGSSGFMDDPFMESVAFSSKASDHIPVEEMIARISNDVDWSRPLHLFPNLA